MRGGGSQEEAACQLYQEAIQLHNEGSIDQDSTPTHLAYNTLTYRC